MFFANYIIYVTFIVGLADLVYSQIGPTPPRLNIPGAISLPYQQQYRTEKQIPQRIRRPVLRNQSPQPTLASRGFDEKPVTEPPEEQEVINTFIPSHLHPQQPYTQTTIFTNDPIHSNTIINPSPNTLINDALESFQQEFNLGRFSDRSQVQTQAQPSPTPPQPQFIQRPSSTALPTDFPSFGGIQRFSRPQLQPQIQLQRQEQQPQPLLIRRPQKTQPQNENYPEPSIQVTRAPPRHKAQKELYHRPAIDHNNLNSIQETRKKPVAQIIRKYRDEHEDGTITWGYENDDGSFKEEIIGMDCITRGSYGYIDPDGTKREYNYETGIKCDPNKRDQEDDDDEDEVGFINYEENKAVLPNGLEIDLSNMGKKKSKRPGALLYQQQQYRN